MLCRRQMRAGRPGVAAVELAVLLPLLVLLMVVAVDFGRIFYFTLTVTNCARNGAVYASQDPAKALDTAGITIAAKKDASNLVLSSVNVTSVPSNNTSPTYVDVTVTYPFTMITNYPGIPRSRTLSRTVRTRVTPYVPG